MAYRVDVTDSAAEDLNDIVFYIADTLSVPFAASVFLNDVASCYDQLEVTPFMYERCADKRLCELGYRRTAIRNYIMVYKVDEEQGIVYVLRFFYCGRDYEQLM